MRGRDTQGEMEVKTNRMIQPSAGQWKQQIVPLEARSRSAKSSSGTKFKCSKAALSLSTGAFQGPPQELFAASTARPMAEPFYMLKVNDMEGESW